MFNTGNIKTLSFLPLLLLFMIVSGSHSVLAQVKTYQVNSFDKIVVSPHIQVNFEEGNSEKVIIHDITEPLEKLNIEVSGKTLHIYLEGAKTITKNETEKNANYKVKHPIYSGTVVRATIIYKNLSELSLRGEQDFECMSPLKGEKFKLYIYGESEVDIKKVDVDSFHTTIYGESELKIRDGSIQTFKIISYGESEVNSTDAVCQTVKVTSYGESKIRVHATDRLKVTSYGESRVRYKGNPEIDRGIIIGEASVKSIE